MEAGDTVELRVPQLTVRGGDITSPSCDAVAIERIGELIRFARGLGPAPAFPDGISIAVGEGGYAELAADEAATPANWVLCDAGECHSALAALEQILTEPVAMDAYFPSTYLVVTEDLGTAVSGPNPICLTRNPGEIGLRPYLPTYVYVDHPKDFIDLCPPPPVLQLEWTEDRQIAAVRLRLAVSGEPIPEQTAAAEAFVAWTRSEGSAPDFADRVQLLQDGGPPFGVSAWLDDPTERSAYSMCSGLPPGSCGIDPTYVIEHHDADVVAARGRTYCRQGTGDLPSDLADAVPADLIRLTVPEPRTCGQDLPVEIWVNDEGAIYAVNLTFAPSEQPALSRGNYRAVAARAFVAWARGGPAPAFADRVRVMLHGQSNGWARNPERLATYSPCSGFGYPECGIDPVAMLARYDGTPTVRVGRASCADGGEVPQQFAAAAPQDVVRLEAPDPGSCPKAWAVELWIDDDGLIYGMNQAGTAVR